MNFIQDFFFVRCDGKYEKVNFSELIFVRARRAYMQVVTESKTYLVLNRMDLVQQYLPKELFCRTHKSYVVTLNRVKAFDNFTVWLCPPSDGKVYRPGMARLQELPLGKHFRKTLRESVSIMPNRAGVFTSVLDEAKFILEGEEMSED